MDDSPLGSFLLPAGYRRPPVLALAREGRVVAEAGRYAASFGGRRRARRATPYVGRVAVGAGDPVVLVPGFLAGDASLALMARSLRSEGFRTYRSHIHVNAGCTLNAVAHLESRLESIAIRRDSRIQVVGHSLGGMLARGIAARRPDLVSGIVTMGSPMLAPGAHHRLLSTGVEVLVRLSRAGVPGLMSEECVAGECARQSFEESRTPLPLDVASTSIYSRTDGVVDWRACVDPEATPVEVAVSHLGMAVDPRVIVEVVSALRRNAESVSRAEVGAGVGA